MCICSVVYLFTFFTKSISKIYILIYICIYVLMDYYDYSYICNYVAASIAIHSATNITRTIAVSMSACISASPFYLLSLFFYLSLSILYLFLADCGRDQPGVAEICRAGNSLPGEGHRRLLDSGGLAMCLSTYMFHVCSSMCIYM